ncbi:TRIO and F-actin-binding protein-like [Homo sapiens]|uniref:TRIO and F-actin-binding protein-like n=1 Tax=Homo sapiens TaxID=9606 RepID=UPI0023DFFF8D|nr:TRIO and F-actin-binding protein-like [Homo sapiens]
MEEETKASSPRARKGRDPRLPVCSCAWRRKPRLPAPELAKAETPGSLCAPVHGGGNQGFQPRSSQRQRPQAPCVLLCMEEETKASSPGAHKRRDPRLPVCSCAWRRKPRLPAPELANAETPGSLCAPVHGGGNQGFQPRSSQTQRPQAPCVLLCMEEETKASSPRARKGRDPRLPVCSCAWRRKPRLPAPELAKAETPGSPWARTTGLSLRCLGRPAVPGSGMEPSRGARTSRPHRGNADHVPEATVVRSSISHGRLQPSGLLDSCGPDDASKGKRTQAGTAAAARVLAEAGLLLNCDVCRNRCFSRCWLLSSS